MAAVQTTASVLVSLTQRVLAPHVASELTMLVSSTTLRGLHEFDGIDMAEVLLRNASQYRVYRPALSPFWLQYSAGGFCVPS